LSKILTVSNSLSYALPLSYDLDHDFRNEGLPGVLGNKGTKGKYRREQGNMTPVLGNAGT